MANEKILVVEDEGITLLYIRKALESLGYVVAGMANSGDDAIRKAMDLRPDLVLMDIVLKGQIDGIDATDKIQEIFNIPVVYLTAHADEATVQRAKTTGPFGYVVKPFKERDIYIAIEFALYKFRMEAERKALIGELQNALDQIKELSGRPPVCGSCRKIRDQKGGWLPIEDYLKGLSEAETAHCLCPDCLGKASSEIVPD